MAEVVRLSIPSRSRVGLMHEVTLTSAAGRLGTRCTCEASTFRPDEVCWHVGQALALAGLAGAVVHPLPPEEGEAVRGERPKLGRDRAAPYDPEAARRARMAARRPAPVEGRRREAPTLIRARVDLAALRAVEVAREQGIDLDPLSASTLERADAILAEARRHGLVEPDDASETGASVPEPPQGEFWPRTPSATPATREAAQAAAQRASAAFARYGA